MALGVMIYGGAGVAGIVLGGEFLDYDLLAKDPQDGQHQGILNVLHVSVIMFYISMGKVAGGTASILIEGDAVVYSNPVPPRADAHRHRGGSGDDGARPGPRGTDPRGLRHGGGRRDPGTGVRSGRKAGGKNVSLADFMPRCLSSSLSGPG